MAGHGFCVGLAMRWIGLRSRGQDDSYDRRTLVANGHFWEATRDQNISRNTPEPWPARFRVVMAQYRAPVDLERCVQKPGTVTARLMTDTIAAGDGLYYFELRGENAAVAIG